MRRSSWIVAGVICGFAPDFANFSCRAMASSTLTPPGKRSSTDFRGSSVDTMVAPYFLLGDLGQLEGVAFDGEIQIAHRKAAQHIAHGSAGEEQVDAGLCAAAACISPTTRNCSALRWLSSMNM